MIKRVFFCFLALIFVIIPCQYISAKPITVIKTSFNGGEVSPSIYGRVDLEKYPHALKKMTNFLPTPQGGAVRRPGFRYIADTKTASEESRLVPFVFSTTQAYIIEFGDSYMRVFKDGGQIWTEDIYTKLLLHFDAEDASIAVADSGNTDHSANITENGNFQHDTDYYKFGFASALFDGSDYLSIADHADWFLSNYEWMIDFWIRFDSISSSYQGVFGQWVDENNHYALNINNTTIWFISRDTGTLEINLQATGQTIAADTWYHIAVVRGWGGTQNDYAITLNGTAVATLTDSDTYPDLAGAFTIGRANTSTGGNETYVTGRIEEFRVTNIGGVGIASYRNTANFDPCETEYPFCDGSGTVYELATTYTEPDLDDLKFAQSADTLYVAHPDFAVREITRTDHDAWSIADVTFTAAPSEWNTAGAGNCGSGSYPQSISFHQDRLVFGGCAGLPDRLWFSKVSTYTNFTTGTGDDDAFVINLLSGRIDAIRWLSSKRKLLAGTIGGEWWLGGGGELGVITPQSKQAMQDTTYGSTALQPVTVGNTLLYLQEPGHKVRELSYNWDEDSYGGNDITILADHLLDTETIKEWAVQKTPYSTVWAVRDDGDLLALTYDKEHRIVAWSVHTTDGDFESVASIPGTVEDELWAIVRRDIDGSSVRYVERLDQFFSSTDIADSFFVDSGLSYEGAGTTTVSGLDHLEGETVYALYDGVVGTDYTVTSGAITVASSSTKIHVGLPYNSDLETLDVEVPDPNNLSMNRRKDILKITFRLQDSAGGDYGTDSSNLFDIQASTSLFTGLRENLTFRMSPALEATVFIRQSEPLPFKVNSLLMEVEVSN